MASVPTISEIERLKEFPALRDVVYLDHAGTTCVSRSQLEAHHHDLLTHLYGNPHSGSPSSQLTADVIDQIRYRILKFFNTSLEKYALVFTSGCTAALKIVAESFDFHGDGCHDNSSAGVTNIHASGADGLEACKEDKLTKNNGRNSVICDGFAPCPRGSFTYLYDSHTSVQGMRELACSKAAVVRTMDCDADGHLEPESIRVLGEQKRYCCCGNHLFAFPGQSNFSGRKYPLDWVTSVQKGQEHWQRSCKGERSEDCQGHWYVLLDAASLVSTSPLDLTAVQPDFVTLSFYKMFGFPTGLGALLIKLQGGGNVLKKTYFGGGTVAVNIPARRFHVNRSSLSHRFEDGTVSFLDIIALRHGFDSLQNLTGGMTATSEKTFLLAKYFHASLSSCCHGNGAQLAEIYCVGGFTDQAKQGAIVTFNLRRSNGDFIGFAEVDTLGQLYNVHLRTGCFCNTGACQKFLNLSDDDLRKNFDAGHVCGDNMDLIEGRPTGAVRVSFGYMSIIEDAQRCLQFIVDCFLDSPSKPKFFEADATKQSSSEIATNTVLNQSMALLKDTHLLSVEPRKKTLITSPRDEAQGTVHSNDGFRMGKSDENKDETVFSICQDRHLVGINVYPVKSCAAFKVKQWPVSSRGLMYDRQWMIVTETGTALSQKREPGLCLLQPSIDLDTQQLRLDYPGMEPVFVSLHNEEAEGLETSMCSGKVCGDRVQSTVCDDNISYWLCEALGRQGCRLIRQTGDDKRTSKLKSSSTQDDDDVKSATGQLSLANESQYLLINSGSVARLQEQITLKAEQGETTETFELENLTDRFRANLVVGGCDAFEEDKWISLQIGSVKFMSQGPCTRCQMVCLNQETGERSKEPLRTLAAYRGSKATFGIHLCTESTDPPTGSSLLSVEDPVFVDGD